MSAARGVEADPAPFMQRALTLARRGEGWVEPNPLVGCVIVRGDRIVGEGHHARFGGPHAEELALRRAGRAARGATVFVTLEPCDHHGKTPPCTAALIAAGIRRVVVAVRDPNPQVDGRGLRRLRRAGITVELGLMRDAAADLLAPFRTRLVDQRPYVIAKWAQSVDGRIATRTGDSQWISGDAARRQVHRWRGRVDAVAVGIHTVLADDPLLTCRGPRPRRVARRVVLDTTLRLPPRCRLVATAREVPTVVLCDRAVADSPRAARLRRSSVIVQGLRRHRDHVDFRQALQWLAQEGATNVLLEGGAALLGTAFDLDVVDEARIFVSPRLLGGAAAPGAIGGRGPDRVNAPARLACCSTRRVGSDLLYRFRRIGTNAAHSV